MRTTKFYVLVDPDSSGGFINSNDYGVPFAYDNEAEAVETCKTFIGETLVLQSVARVIDKTTYKVERIK